MKIDKKYRKAVIEACTAAGSIGIPGTFSFGGDIPALINIWQTLVIKISEKADKKISKSQANKIVINISKTLSGYLSISVATKLLHIIPGAGTIISLTALGVNSTLNAVFTYKLALSTIQYFEENDNVDAESTEKFISRNTSTLPTLNDFRSLNKLLESSKRKGL